MKKAIFFTLTWGILTSIIYPADYAFTRAAQYLFQEPDRLSDQTTTLAAGEPVKLVATTTSSRWVRVRTLFKSYNVEGYTLLSKLVLQEETNNSCLNTESLASLYKIVPACLGASCIFKECSNDKDLFFLPGQRFVILPPCPAAGKFLEGSWQQKNSSIEISARLKDTRVKCQKRCQKDRKCRKDCTRLFRKKYRSSRASISAGGSIKTKNNSAAATLKIKGRPMNLQWRGKNLGCFKPVQIAE